MNGFIFVQNSNILTGAVMMASYQAYVKVVTVFAITICLSSQLVSSGYLKWVSTSVFDNFVFAK